jgi:hypothetical protein
LRPFYRIWQFLQAVTARPLDTKVKKEIKGLLNPLQQRLFDRLSPGEQQHSYRVMSALHSAGQEQPDLLAAALLHDVGKTFIRRAWWDRVIVVLGQALLPGKAAQWSAGEARGWTRPFVVKAHHAEWGAAVVEAAESSPRTVTLIRRHHDDPATIEDEELKEWLSLLQWADDHS